MRLSILIFSSSAFYDPVSVPECVAQWPPCAPSSDSDSLCQRPWGAHVIGPQGGTLVVSVRFFFFMEILRSLLYIWESSLSFEWVRIVPTCLPHLFLDSGFLPLPKFLYAICQLGSVFSPEPQFLASRVGWGMGTFKLLTAESTFEAEYASVPSVSSSQVYRELALCSGKDTRRQETGRSLSCSPLCGLREILHLLGLIIVISEMRGERPQHPFSIKASVLSSFWPLTPPLLLSLFTS